MKVNLVLVMAFLLMFIGFGSFIYNVFGALNSEEILDAQASLFIAAFSLLGFIIAMKVISKNKRAD